MKKILLILLFLGVLLVSTDLSAQDKIDRLSDKIDRLAEQMAIQQIETSKQIAELAKQQAISSTKIDGIDKRIDAFEKSIDKRLDTQSNFMLAIMGLIGLLITGVLGFISYIFWDRKKALKPIEATTAELVKEIALLKEKELKHQERETKSENLLKKLLEKFPDLANLA